MAGFSFLRRFREGVREPLSAGSPLSLRSRAGSLAARVQHDTQRNLIGQLAQPEHLLDGDRVANRKGILRETSNRQQKQRRNATRID